MDLGRVPSWLRWLLILPVSASAAALAFMAVQLGYKILTVIWGTGNVGAPARFQTDPDDPFNYVVYQGLSGAAMSLAFVYSGIGLAPNYKARVALVLAVITSLYFGTELVFGALGFQVRQIFGGLGSALVHIVYSIGGIAGGVIAWRANAKESDI